MDNKKAAILTVINRKGEKFKLGDKVYFFGSSHTIKAFRTDSAYPNWLGTKCSVKGSSWIMAHLGKSWGNIDFMSKKRRANGK